MVRGSDGRRLNDGRREDGGDQGKGLRRFASTVAFHERAREPYGESFFAEVARTLGFGGGERLLDLGTGPGLLALGFAPFVGEVIGVDPEPAMLEAARQAAQRARVALRLVEARAESLPAGIGTVGSHFGVRMRFQENQ